MSYSILTNTISTQIEAVERKMLKISAFDPRYNNLIRRRNELQIALIHAEYPVEMEKGTVHTNKPI